MTKKEILEELQKCANDPVYFINHYCQTTHPTRGLIPLHLYEFQEETIQAYQTYRFNIILKARQLGISTITAAYALWLMLFHREKNILTIATKQGTAANVVKKTKSMFHNLPKWMKQLVSIVTDNRAALEFNNGSQFKAESTSSSAGRSEALSLLIIDEAAHVEGLEELWTGLRPTLTLGGACIALSTPNGAAGWFYETYEKAVNDEDESDFNPIELMWWVHPDHDDEWLKKESADMSKRQLAQEHLCSFNASGDTVFETDHIERIRNAIKEPITRAGFDRNVWIWRDPQVSVQYLMSVDVARGDGQDHSTFLIFDLSTMECVAEYRGKLPTDTYGELIYTWGTMYNLCTVVVENNTYGDGVLRKLIEMEYSNIYYSMKGSGEYVSPLRAASVENAIPGFSTSWKSRPLVISKMEEYVRNKMLTLYSKRIVYEMTTFVWKDGKPQAQRKRNDDLIMACAIACWVKDVVFATSLRDVEYQKAFLGAISRQGMELDSTIPGMKGRGTMTNYDHQEHVREYRWLYSG